MLAEKSAAAAVPKPQTLMVVSKQTQSSKPIFKQPSVVDPNCVPMEQVQSDTVSISGSVPETDVDQLLDPRSIPSKLCRTRRYGGLRPPTSSSSGGDLGVVVAAAAAGNRLSVRSSSSREQAVNAEQQQQGTGCQ